MSLKQKGGGDAESAPAQTANELSPAQRTNESASTQPATAQPTDSAAPALPVASQPTKTVPEPPASKRRRFRFIIAPGNGGCGADIMRCNWYAWLHAELTGRGHESLCVDWPDPYVCHQSKWMAFARHTLKADANTIVVGHRC